MEEGGCRGGAGWAVGESCRVSDQMSEFYTTRSTGRREGKSGRKEEGTEVKSCLPVCLLS